MFDDLPQFRPGDKAHRALDYLEDALDVISAGELRDMLGIGKSGKARTRFAHAMNALEENGFVTREIIREQSHFTITGAGKSALQLLNAGKEVFGLPCDQRRRPPRVAASVRFFSDQTRAA